MQFTAVYLRVPEGFVAFVEELPGANTQGSSLEEARENLREAVALVLKANRELAEQSLYGQTATREPSAKGLLCGPRSMRSAQRTLRFYWEPRIR